jgi:hypothetical protein
MVLADSGTQKMSVSSGEGKDRSVMCESSESAF